MDLYKEIAELIKTSNYVVAFTGAGISVESGIPPFRGPDGLWSKYDPEEFAHIKSFLKNPFKVWGMLRDMFYLIYDSKPNLAHKVLAELEKLGYLKSIITQNIDGLHQLAGNKKVIEYHGNCRKLICINCKNSYPLEKQKIQELPYPICNNCQAPLKPDVIFFGEPIPLDIIKQAEEEALKCSLMLIIGTSGMVYPAANLPYIAKSNEAIIIEINLEQTSYTYSISDYFLKGKAEEMLFKIFQNIIT